MENVTSISALEAPEQATQLAKEILSPAPDAIFIEPLPDGSVELPGGYLSTDGEVFQNATVRELNGADEEYLAKPEVMKSMGRWTAALLQRGVVQIGPHENPPAHVISGLLMGDRDMLMLAIRRMTYGDKFEIEANCPACNERLNIEYDLSVDIPVKKLESERVFPFALRNGGQVMVSLATGADGEAILNNTNRTLAEINTVLLSRCVTSMDGIPLGIDGVKTLGILDRRNILKEVTDRQPGPKYSDVELECAVCARKFPLRIDLTDLFR